MISAMASFLSKGSGFVQTFIIKIECEPTFSCYLFSFILKQSEFFLEICFDLSNYLRNRGELDFETVIRNIKSR